jgi:hypothetical protein
MREGDIVVTRVGQHYAIGRLKADGATQISIEQQTLRVDALKRACQLAGANHQVFILEKTGSAASSLVDCAQIKG